MGRRPLQRIQAALAARRYFVGQQTKSKIADDIGVSRFKVARLIDAAIKQGIVRFVITEPNLASASVPNTASRPCWRSMAPTCRRVR
jgi:DNA-binding transcriptional regulator LsrR (DeoR family)